jgi:hypothetical protein
MFKEPERSTGVSPSRSGSPHNAITPQKVLHHHLAQHRGGTGRQARPPPLSYRCFVFHILVKGIYRAKKYIIFLQILFLDEKI